jgi:carboxyl-terminal processing protease
MGSYPGVGIEVVACGGMVRILRPIDDIGADLAGAIARMRGASGGLVQLSIRRDGSPELLEFALRRAQVEVHSVLAESLEPGFGYVQITTFSDTTAQELPAPFRD